MSEKKTRERFERRAKGRLFVATDLGREVCGQILPRLSEYMRTKAPKPPPGLERVVHNLNPDDLALAALGPLLHQIDSAGERRTGSFGEALIAAGVAKYGKTSDAMRVHLSMGKALRDRAELRELLKHDKKAHDRIVKAAKKQRAFAIERKHHPTWKHRDWRESDCCYAGIWLMDCAMALPYFYLDKEGLPHFTEGYQDVVDKLREELTYRDPIFLPCLKPPSPWKGWRNQINPGERISATFVRNCPSAEPAITKAFRQRAVYRHNEAKNLPADPRHEFRHVDAVNALQAVPWKINERMIPVVAQFAGVKKRPDGVQVGKGVNGVVVGKRIDENRVKGDVATANELAKHDRFYLPHNCDSRGRIFAIPDFNFQREDHVRALFLFANGQRIGASEQTNPTFAATKLALELLKAHVANMADQKGDLLPRIKWTDENRPMIERIAHDPIGTIAEWQSFPEPFSFVAGCMELAGAWKEGMNFITRLPVLSDATCSGVQHLSALAGDEETGRRVNLGDSDTRKDIYGDITNEVIKELEAIKDTDERAAWWLADERINRALIKRPASTFGYSATVRGMRDQITKAYSDKRGGAEPRLGHATLLAKTVMDVAKNTMPKCAKVMKFLRRLAKERFNKGLPLEWHSPSSFPVSSADYDPDWTEVDSPLRGERVRFRVADGYKKLNKTDCLNAAAPNFVHSLDAAHMAATINHLVGKGITDVVGIHDCWGGLAPDAHDILKAIRDHFELMYRGPDWLRVLCRYAQSNIVPPNRGSLEWFNPKLNDHMTT
ncbi:MAG: hypothetical protein C5B58_13710 [Acidobacteria bacterium]|nr:MAG: hypothetical protein C5B58_13710 [Acidobacteriota bacterium]